MRINDTNNDANILNSRLVLTLKSAEAPDGKKNARHVAQGYHEGEKPFIIQKSTGVKHSSLYIIVSFAVSTGFDLSTKDVDQPYIQRDK